MSLRVKQRRGASASEDGEREVNRPDLAPGRPFSGLNWSGSPKPLGGSFLLYCRVLP